MKKKRVLSPSRSSAEHDSEHETLDRLLPSSTRTEADRRRTTREVINMILERTDDIPGITEEVQELLANAETERQQRLEEQEWQPTEQEQQRLERDQRRAAQRVAGEQARAAQ